MLAACGGPDSSNSVPTVSGELSQTLKIEAESQFTLALEDADGDSLQFNVADQPDWLAVTIENDQAIFTVNPRFFDIGEHSVQFTLFDGTDLVSHTLSFTLEDNPEAHQEVALNHNDLEGSWVFNNGYQLHLYGDSRGLWKTPENDFFPINWAISDDAQSLGLTVHVPSCVDRCDPIEQFDLNMVFADGNNARIGVLEEGENSSFANATKQAHSAMPEGTYYQLGALANGRMAHFDSESSEATFHVLLDNTPLQSPALFSDTEITAQYEQENNEASTFTTSSQLFNDKAVVFGNEQDGAETRVNFDFFAESIETRFSDDNVSIVEIGIKQALVTELTDQQIQNIEGLQAFLDRDIKIWVEYVPVQESQLTLEAGKSYSSTFLFDNDETAEEDEEPFINYTTLTIVDDTQATLSTRLDTESSLTSQDVSYSVEGNQITLNINDNALTYSLFDTPNGHTIASIPRIDDTPYAMSLFIEKPNDVTDVLSGKRLFNASSSAFHGKSVSTTGRLELTQNDTQLAKIDDVLTLTNVLENGAIHAISASEPTCEVSMSIEECKNLQDLYAAENSNYVFRNRILEPLLVSDGIYYMNVNAHSNFSGIAFSVSLIREYVEPTEYKTRFSVF